MNENYETQDICLATAMQCSGTPISGIEWRDSQRASFYFEGSKELIKSVEAYWRNELRIEPKTFFDCLKNTKTRLYNR